MPSRALFLPLSPLPLPRRHPSPAISFRPSRPCAPPGLSLPPLHAFPRTPVAAAKSPSPLIQADGTVGGENGVGVFAIYDSSQTLQYVGISRDVATSLRRALARRPSLAHFYTAEYATARRPSRTALEALRDDVVGGRAVPGLDGGGEQRRWEGAVDVRRDVELREEEKGAIEAAELGEVAKVLKKVARRVQGDVEEVLRERGLTEKLKFAPKMKSEGLLDVESVKVKVPDSIGSSTARLESE